jgi:hypothetical protein
MTRTTFFIELETMKMQHLRPREFFARLPEYGDGSAHHGDRSYLIEGEDPPA